MEKITAYIIAFNEEHKIRAALNSVLWADEIIVADSFSEDDTAKIAESMGARVVQIPFNGFGALRNEALKACSHPWIFSLDSDERCTAEARDEMLAIIRDGSPHEVFFLPRRNYFMGRWIRHSGFYPDYRQPQFFRKGAMTYKPDPVHEGFIAHSEKPIGYLKNPIWQMPFRDLAEVQHKANRYSTLGANRMAAENRRVSMLSSVGHGLVMFFQHYVFKLGFLDGWAGFVIAFSNFEGTFYKYAKLHCQRDDWKFPETKPLRRTD